MSKNERVLEYLKNKKPGSIISYDEIKEHCGLESNAEAIVIVKHLENIHPNLWYPAGESSVTLFGEKK